MQIPFFRYARVFAPWERELTEAFLRVARAGAFILQEDVRLFEEELAAYCGVAAAVGVGNATDAIELVLRALGIGRGDEVILPSHTFVASAAAVVHVGATPVLAEIGADHLLDPADAARRITPRTRAIMPTQLNGRTADMDALGELAARHGLLLLEDSAQGLGSRFRGRMAGTFAPAGVYSFYPAKTLGALGDAGAIVTDDVDLADRLRRLRDHGRDGHGADPALWGRNSRLDNLQAAFLRVKLRHVDREIETRRRLAARYHAGLEGLACVTRPPFDDDPARFDAFQNYELEADDRDGLREHLARRGVGTALQWGGKGLHQFDALGTRCSLPVTDRILARSLLLPMNTSLTDEEVDYVVRAVREYYEGRA
ncbi:MAG TPA: DegT/DnrJ/EryC1/StrS family aminotransferase [Longimicrobiales bacterium]|nr:DegT/DnrJ/EryC1/StrS family aminotransferase [Longimicrobiales bacterium]